MTNEEAIAIIENEKKCVNRANKNDYCNRDCYNCELVKTDAEILTALDIAIKAIEQQPFINKPCISEGVCREDKIKVLDKIRAEIEEQKECRCFDDDDMCIYRTGLDDALYIIDKYKTETEEV